MKPRAEDLKQPAPLSTTVSDPISLETSLPISHTNSARSQRDQVSVEQRLGGAARKEAIINWLRRQLAILDAEQNIRVDSVVVEQSVSPVDGSKDLQVRTKGTIPVMTAEGMIPIKSEFTVPVKAEDIIPVEAKGIIPVEVENKIPVEKNGISQVQAGVIPATNKRKRASDDGPAGGEPDGKRRNTSEPDIFEIWKQVMKRRNRIEKRLKRLLACCEDRPTPKTEVNQITTRRDVSNDSCPAISGLKTAIGDPKIDPSTTI